MKDLQDIRHEIAREFGYDNWDSFHQDFSLTTVGIDEVAKRYATEAIKGFAKCITQIVGPEGKHKGWFFDVDKADKFLKDNNLINELK